MHIYSWYLYDLFSLTDHVESIILMTKCGFKEKWLGHTTICSSSWTKNGSKLASVDADFDPFFATFY